MSETATTGSELAGLKALQDRLEITDALYRYSSAVDSFDYAAIRGLFADQIWAQYGNSEPVTDPDALVKWISDATATVVWQHHLLSVYEVTIHGHDAKALSYLTSHQVFSENPDHAVILVARYHDDLRRVDDIWKLTRRVMEVLWGESRAADDMLAGIGGRGPKVWSRD